MTDLVKVRTNKAAAVCHRKGAKRLRRSDLLVETLFMTKILSIHIITY